MKNGKNNEKDFMTNMPNGSQMVFSLGAFLLVKKADSRVFKSGNVSSKPNGSSKVRRTTLRHSSINDGSKGFANARNCFKLGVESRHDSGNLFIESDDIGE